MDTQGLGSDHLSFLRWDLCVTVCFIIALKRYPRLSPPLLPRPILFLKCHEKSGSYFVFRDTHLARVGTAHGSMCCCQCLALLFLGDFMVALGVLQAVCDEAPICLNTAESFCDVCTANCRVSLFWFSLHLVWRLSEAQQSSKCPR